MITCFLENQNKVFFRHVTVNAIIRQNNKILLGKRGLFNGKPILEFGKWGLIGGFMDHGENLVQTVKRETMEESGWEVDNVKLFRINDNPHRPKEDRQNVDFIFIADAVKQSGKSDKEVTRLQWFDINQLPAKEEVAFDHDDALELYRRYLKEKFILPVLG